MGAPEDDVKVEMMSMAYAPDDATEVARLRALVTALEAREKTRPVGISFAFHDDGHIALVVTCPASKFSEQRIASWVVEGLGKLLSEAFAAASCSVAAQ